MLKLSEIMMKIVKVRQPCLAFHHVAYATGADGVICNHLKSFKPKQINAVCYVTIQPLSMFRPTNESAGKQI